MDFVDALRVLGRRWQVVLIGLLLTGGAGAYAITAVPTQYQARAQYVMLLPSGANGAQNPTNPYINLNSGLIFASTLIASDMGTKDVVRSLVKSGFESDFSVAQGTTGGPVLDVIVDGTDRVDVLETRDELLRRFDEKLNELQDISGIPSRQLIFSRTNAVDPLAEVVPGAKKKALVLIAAVGLIVTLIMTFTVDGILRRRTARKLAGTPTAPGAPEPPENDSAKNDPSKNQPTKTGPAKNQPSKNQPSKTGPEMNGPAKPEADPPDGEPGGKKPRGRLVSRRS